jgi:hypothetical protein
MSVDGTWTLTIDSPLGQQTASIEFATQPDGSLSGNARHLRTGELAPLQSIELKGDRLVWRQSIRNPMKLNVIFDVVIEGGNRMAGTAKARMMPGTAIVKGERADAASAESA